MPCVQVAGRVHPFKHFLFDFLLLLLFFTCLIGPTWTKLSQFDALPLKRWSGTTNICVDTIGLDATQRCCGKIRGSMKRIVSTDLFHVPSNAASKVSLCTTIRIMLAKLLQSANALSSLRPTPSGTAKSVVSHLQDKHCIGMLLGPAINVKFIQSCCVRPSWRVLFSAYGEYFCLFASLTKDNNYKFSGSATFLYKINASSSFARLTTSRNGGLVHVLRFNWEISLLFHQLGTLVQNKIHLCTHSKWADMKGTGRGWMVFSLCTLCDNLFACLFAEHFHSQAQWWACAGEQRKWKMRTIAWWSAKT